MTRPIKVILLDIEPESFTLACRAAKYQIERKDGGKSSIMQYGDDPKLTFYVKRNKSSITVRKC